MAQAALCYYYLSDLVVGHPLSPSFNLLGVQPSCPSLGPCVPWPQILFPQILYLLTAASPGYHIYHRSNPQRLPIPKHCAFYVFILLIT